MNTIVLKLSESDAFLKNISIRTIKDVRALDVDLLLILTNGEHIVISGGAMQALSTPDMVLQFADPTVLIRHAQVANPREWQHAPTLSTLKLDQGDFFESGLRVDTPPHAKVKVILLGRDVLGHALQATLPESRADASGHAIVSADDASMIELQRFDANQSVTAQVTVIDGYNRRQPRRPDHRGRSEGAGHHHR
ncbi:hypothetical protein [Herbaspirillum sp. NPDC087042]|uniref:hypothetical protein n=1 Tax=Herbaspirillum sp. NPDC087042 TaxID=3364004 RepID=UPI00382FEEF0